MTASRLFTTDLDLIRFILIASVAVGSAVYARTNLSAGGTLTGGYLSILALEGRWGAIALAFATTVIVYVVMRLVVTRHLPLPMREFFVGAVVVSALVSTSAQLMIGGASSVATIDLPGGLVIFLTVGSYITPGLLAYDITHQGLRPTSLGLGLVVVGTFAVVTPVLALANWLQPESTTIFEPFEGNIPDNRFWFAVLASTLIASALRFSFDVRSAGFIGSVFLVEFLTPAAFVTVVSAALAASLLVSFLRRHVVLTPRQRFQVAFMVGAMSAWTGLYWGSRLGWAPAEEANSFAVEPLVVVGLIASDMGRSRSSTAKVLGGLAAGSGFVWLVLELAASGIGWRQVLSGATVAIVPMALAVPGARRLLRAWRNAVALGDTVAGLSPSAAGS